MICEILYLLINWTSMPSFNILHLISLTKNTLTKNFWMFAICVPARNSLENYFTFSSIFDDFWNKAHLVRSYEISFYSYVCVCVWILKIGEGVKLVSKNYKITHTYTWTGASWSVGRNANPLSYNFYCNKFKKKKHFLNIVCFYLSPN